MSINIQVDHFDSGSIARISPSIWIVIEAGFRRPRPAHPTDYLCEACGRVIQSWRFWRKIGEARKPEKVLSCQCAVVVYRSPITEAEITKNWAGFRQLKARIATQLIAIDEPERN
jgi:hypothetical protein